MVRKIGPSSRDANIAMPKVSEARPAAEKTRLRQRSVSIAGAGCRIDRNRASGSSAAAPIRQARVLASAQPQPLPWVRPSTARAMPAATSTVPSQVGQALAGVPVRGQPGDGQVDQRQSDRDVDQEDRPPAEGVDQQAAEAGPGRRGQRAGGGPEADRVGAPRRRGAGQDQAERRRDHAGGRGAL
nr:hypothetical protein GCM10020092_057060 [Actinoplanes digitatis]